VLAELARELAARWEWLRETDTLDLGTAEHAVRARRLAIGGRLLEAGVAARGSGQAGPRVPGPCGGAAGFEGYRVKQVQPVVGWVAIRRAYDWCRECGRGHGPLDTGFGLTRDSHSPGGRRAIARLGALLPFAQAAATLAEVAGVQTSASSARVVTEAVGTRREQEVAGAVATAWCDGRPPTEVPAPARLAVALDGVLVPGADGAGKEAKVGVVAPEQRGPSGELRRAARSDTASFAPAAAFGRRLALEAHRRGLEAAAEVVVLGDGAESGARWAMEPGGRALPDGQVHRGLVPR